MAELKNTVKEQNLLSKLYKREVRSVFQSLDIFNSRVKLFILPYAYQENAV